MNDCWEIYGEMYDEYMHKEENNNKKAAFRIRIQPDLNSRPNWSGIPSYIWSRNPVPDPYSLIRPEEIPTKEINTYFLYN